jgi:WD40 repeat protein
MNGHSNWVTALAFSRDGQFLVSGADDTTILVWNFSAGAQQPDYVLEGHTGWVKSVAFSPDAKLVVSTSADDTMRVWSGAVSVDESVMEGHTGAVTTIAFSHDGRHIASGSKDSTIRVWDAAIGRHKSVLEGHESYINRVVFSPDSQTIASSSWDKTVRLWDVATGTQVHAVLHHPWKPDNIVFSHDGQSILTINHYTSAEWSGASEACVWEVATGTQKFLISYSRLALKFHRRYRNSVIFSPSDQLLVATLHFQTDSSSCGGSDEEFTSSSSGGSDQWSSDYKVWDASTGVELAVQDLTPALARDVEGALLSRNEQAVTPYHSRTMRDGWVQVSQDKVNWYPVCWLPAERQLSPEEDAYAHHGQKVCIGAASGAVTILDFSNVPMHWAC